MIIVGVDDGFNRKIANQLDAKLIPLEIRRFPDGEVCPRILIKDDNDIKGETVIFTHRMRASSCRPNDYLTEILLTLLNLNEANPRRIILVAPYFVYARQDTAFRVGEPKSAKYVAKTLEWAGVDVIVTVSTHFHRMKTMSDFFTKAQGINVSGFTPLAKYVKNNYELHKPVIIAPDEEAKIWAEEFAKILGAKDYTALKKERDLDTGEIRTYVGELDVKGRDVIVVDDIVSTGGTMANAILEAVRRGARRVISCFVHPVLAPGALEKIMKAGVFEAIATDTLVWDKAKVTVTNEISKVLLSILQ